MTLVAIWWVSCWVLSGGEEVGFFVIVAVWGRFCGQCMGRSVGRSEEPAAWPKGKTLLMHIAKITYKPLRSSD